MASQISSSVLRPGSSSPRKQRLKSFINRRSDSSDDGSPIASPMSIPTGNTSDPSLSIFAQYAVTSPLAELHPNQNPGQYSPTRSPVRSPNQGYFENGAQPIRSPIDPPKERGRDTDRDPNQSNRRGPLASFTGRPGKEGASKFMSRESSPVKLHKKTKSTTNLASFLIRPKTAKKEDEGDMKMFKDKENRSPSSSIAPQQQQPPPIYRQFTAAAEPSPTHVPPRSADPRTNSGSMPTLPFEAPERVKTSHGTNSGLPFRGAPSHSRAKSVSAGSSRPTSAIMAKRSSAEPYIDPTDIDKHLEAMLDRRNIPENQRYKMRNLAASIKEEFIRQDWAEMTAASSKDNKSGSLDSHHNNPASAYGSAVNDRTDAEASAKTKRSRGRSFTLSRIGVKTTKKSDKNSSMGRHLRSKSSETLADEKPLGFINGGEGSSGAGHGNGTGLLAKIMGTAPADFVSYLRKTTKPQNVEVGKLHKLRLLLRNETVSWIEDFIKQGGMKEMVGLLHRIMEIEWRDDHEDALLHENLLCLKALSTTALAQIYIHSIQDLLFPRLLHLLFDPEKKGPSEFTTRNIVTSILFLYIETGSPKVRISRAANVLVHLRDPEPPEHEKPLNWVTNMHRPRPYRVWTKEVVNVTKEVFWIFLHHLNIVAMPDAKTLSANAVAEAEAEAAGESTAALRYMARHFPAERPPVAAAPYVGGVEWDATNYLASHVDLLNAIIACTPTRDARNQLRADLRVSGWERCLGGSLRLCKEKFYPSVHEALRKWVAAATEDGWDVKDVRYGPPPESRNRSVSPSKSKAAPMMLAPLNVGNGPMPAGPSSGGNANPVMKPVDLPVPKLLTDSGGETTSSRGYNAAPAAEIRADDSWLR